MRLTCVIVTLLSVTAMARADQRPPVASPATPKIERPAASPAAPKIERLLDAIRQVETGQHPDPANALGDQGRSLGPYQITYAYWKDSGVPGQYKQVRNRAYAERVVTAYWQRYCPEALARNDWRTLAKVHNGGPRGPQVLKTILYWLKVRQALGW
jgi:hypothetical protein